MSLPFSSAFSEGDVVGAVDGRATEDGCPQPAEREPEPVAVEPRVPDGIWREEYVEVINERSLPEVEIEVFLG